MKTPEERLQVLEKLALELNAALPADVMLKGDGTIWIKEHGNDGTQPRAVRQEVVLQRLYKAINFSNQMISV